MSQRRSYSFYAVSYELNRREFRRKLGLFPEEMRYYVILANSIIGSENAKRVAEIPDAVVEDSREFAGKLLSMVSPEDDDGFRKVVETFLIETMKDELRFSCPNCENFDKCLDLDNLSAVGLLFKRRANGEETKEIREKIDIEVDNALKRTPYIDTDVAYELCGDFRHQYRTSGIGEVFARYSEIASELHRSFGLDYGNIQKKMIEINMDFCEKSRKIG